MLKKEMGLAIAKFLYEDVICRWGLLCEIITDNGQPFLKALPELEKCYHIKHICILGYNSHVNRIVKRAHYDVRQALYKAADGDKSKWSGGAHSVYWSERALIRRRLGASPYFIVTGTQPLLPFDISKATYLLPPAEAMISTTELVA